MVPAPGRSSAASRAVAAEGTPYPDRYGRDLTQAAAAGSLGPFIGRRKELLQVVQTLARRTKNNPVLVGEAGVGKTAIVEALAMRVVEGKDPQVLTESGSSSSTWDPWWRGPSTAASLRSAWTNAARDPQPSRDHPLH